MNPFACTDAMPEHDPWACCRVVENQRYEVRGNRSVADYRDRFRPGRPLHSSGCHTEVGHGFLTPTSLPP
jgi:hypothetical protein